MASFVTRRRTGPKRLLPAGALPFRRRLLSWYGRHRRRLPWRGVRDPYAVLVSEIMLQQTQVARVLQFYPRFLARYPTLEDLAAAPADPVRESWDGRGHCARARDLHAGARPARHKRGARAVGGLEPGADGPGGDVLHGAEAAVWRVSRAATLCRWGALGFVALGRSAGADGLSVPALRVAVLELALGA